MKERIYIWTVNQYGEVEYFTIDFIIKNGVPDSHHEEFGIPYDDRLYYLYQGDMHIHEEEGEFTPIELIA